MLVPGATKALAARIIEDLGFEAVYVSGAGVTNTFLGVPDLGFVSLTEMAQHTAAIRDAVKIPVIVDADTGFGNLQGEVGLDGDEHKRIEIGIVETFPPLGQINGAVGFTSGQRRSPL